MHSRVQEAGLLVDETANLGDLLLMHVDNRPHLVLLCCSTRARPNGNTNKRAVVDAYNYLRNTRALGATVPFAGTQVHTPLGGSLSRRSFELGPDTNPRHHNR